jgi:clan AA aspartic protease (TIGR02281 family)
MSRPDSATVGLPPSDKVCVMNLKNVRFPLVILIIPLFITGYSFALENLEITDIESRLNTFEKIMDAFFRGKPREKGAITMNRLIDEYNVWIKTQDSQRGAWQEKLSKEFKTLEVLKKQIETLDQELMTGPDSTDKKAVQEYNDKVIERNALVEKYNKEGELYKTHESAYNTANKKLKEEISVREKNLEAQKKEYDIFIETYNQWINEKRDEAFFKELNRFYAGLLEQDRQGKNKPRLDKYINRLRAIRQELGQLAVDDENSRENGVLIVKAIFPGEETCFLILDTGASRVSLSPEMADVLGLSKKLGEEIEILVAGGMTVKGRSVDIPWITVVGKTAKNIQGIILSSSKPGIDGLLGRSFLKRFILDIDDEREPKVILRARFKSQ